MRFLVFVWLLAACGGPAPRERAAPLTTSGAPPRLPAVRCDEDAATRTARYAPEETRLAVVREIVATCGEAAVVAITTDLVDIQTVAEIRMAREHSEVGRMAGRLHGYAEPVGLEFEIFGEDDAFEIVLPGRDRSRRLLRLVAHGDVVPVNDPPAIVHGEIPPGWTLPPFVATVRDGRLYGRGTEDDKGPIAAALYVMTTLREAGVVPEGDVVLAIGMAEEHEWDGMRRYAEQARPVEQTVSIDSDYPVVVGQSGFVAWGVRAPLPRSSSRRPGPRARAELAEGGLFLTQIPDSARLVVRPRRGETIEALEARIDEAASVDLTARADPAFTATTERTADGVELRVTGASAHSSVAEEGRNALWPLATIASRLELEDGPVASILAIVARYFDGDHYGERAGLSYEDASMGKLLVAPTKLRTELGYVTLEVNMRRPAGRTEPEFRASLDAFFARLRETTPALETVEEIYVGEPHLADRSSPLVRTLLGIYRDLSGDVHAEPRAIRGGTYARLFPGAVDFGPAIPGETYRGHAADEFITLDALNLTTRAYLEVILALSRAEPNAM